MGTGTPVYWVYGGAGGISYATWKTKVFYDSVTPDVNSLTSDPLFLDPGGSSAENYKISKDSACRKAGEWVGITTDYFSKPRYSPDADIGAAAYWGYTPVYPGKGQ